MISKEPVLRPQHLPRSISNQRRTATHLAAREGLDSGYMRDLMKTARRGFRKEPMDLTSPSHLPFQKEAKTEARKHSEAHQESQVRKAAQVLDGLLDLYADPQPRHLGTHERKKHAHRHRQHPSYMPQTNIAMPKASHELAEISPNRGLTAVIAQDRQGLYSDEEDGYVTDDSPSESACAHGDYSYIYDLYLRDL